MRQEAPVEQLGHNVQLGVVARILQAVRGRDDARALRDLGGREGHRGQHERKLDGKRLDAALVVGVPLVLGVGVREDLLVCAEILEHALADQLLLPGVDHQRGALDLLDVRIFAVEHHHARVVALKVVLGKALALGVDVLLLEVGREPRQKADGRGVFDAVDDALVLRAHHLQGRQHRAVVRAEEVVLVLVLG